LNTDGSVDPSFFPRGSVHGTYFIGGIRTLAMQTDGKIVVGGNFIAVDGVERYGVARFQPDGALDTTFDPGSGAWYESFGTRFADVNSLAWQRDGKIVIAGNFTNVNGVSRNGIARLNANGSLDLSFNPGDAASPIFGFPSVYGVALQWDGKLIACGGFTNFNGFGRQYIVRLLPHGAVDPVFDAGTDWGYAGLTQCAVQPDGQIVVNSGLLGITRLHSEPPLRFTAIDRLPGNRVRLSLQAQAGRPYYLQSSSNLIDWITVQTNSVANCALEFLISESAGSPPKFYRAFVW
jgi:uncharacterized delta-60 repeat protein